MDLQFDLRDLASYDEEKAAFVLEKGSYILRIGNSSVHTMPIAVIELDEDAVVTKTRNCCGKPEFKEWKPENAVQQDVPDFIPKLYLKAEDIEAVTVNYERTYPIDEEVTKLTDEQLAVANVGGNDNNLVAGAVGFSTPLLRQQGFRTIVMADGPAGLRLTPLFYRDDKGLHSCNGTSSHSENFREFLPGIVRWFMDRKVNKKAPQGAKVESQWCTAIPIGTAIAQSWNTGFACFCGDLVGDEMERFKINLWLAPALNIHRSILCGRNFEYFSEDPLISGKMAGAITLGVQKHPGCGTTIKHYSTNNQETNRYGNSSNVSERALREIYVKGFGIAVREAQPKAVMTSYNLLNGKHTAESRDLIENILRCEFGFGGIVMTDWWIADFFTHSKADIHPIVQPKLTAAAGSDLFMPGRNKDRESMAEGLRDGSVTREQLQINATRLYRMAKELCKD